MLAHADEIISKMLVKSTNDSLGILKRVPNDSNSRVLLPAEYPYDY